MEVTKSSSLGRALTIAALSAVLAFVAGQQSALAHFRGLAGQQIPALLAHDPALRVFSNDHRLAQVLGQGSLPDAEIQQMRAAASAALAGSPLNAAALRQLGVLADPGQTTAAGAPYFAAAEGVSRRELGTELALINAAIIGQDLGDLLLHYDRTLRVYQSAQTLLFPALNQASAQASVRDGLRSYAASPWFVPWLGQLLSSAGQRDDLAPFLAQVRPQLASADADRLDTLLLARLLRDGQYAAARSWLEQTAPDRRAAMTDLGITPATTDPQLDAFAWTFKNREAVTVGLGDDRSLAVSIDPGHREPVAERITVLPPATYEFAVNLAANPDSPVAQLTWDLRCEGGDNQAPVWSFAPDLQTGQQGYSSRFVLAGGCPAQRWTLSVTSHSAQRASSVRINRMSLTPVQHAR